jgi:hypothetical protein
MRSQYTKVAILRAAVLVMCCVCASIAIYTEEYTLSCFWALMIIASQLERLLSRLPTPQGG